EVDAGGDLLVRTEAGTLRQHRPVLYQEENGARRSIEGRYVLRGPIEAGFEVGSYDPARPLVIDPVLSYSTYLGGDNDHSAYAVAVDPAGNAYLAGYTISEDFPVVGAGDQGSAFDAIVVKLGPSGQLVYSTYLGGTGLRGDQGNAIAVDADGNAYVA